MQCSLDMKFIRPIYRDNVLMNILDDRSYLIEALTINSIKLINKLGN